MTPATQVKPIFPSVSASNLAKRPFNLPADFEGAYNLVLIAFKQHQQRAIDTWLPLAQRLASHDSRWRYYELPVIRRMNPLYRAFIDGGMRGGIPDQAAREATITLYLDKATFRQALHLPHEDTIYAIVVQPDGTILWQTSGPYSEEKARSLLKTMQSEVDSRLMPEAVRD